MRSIESFDLCATGRLARPCFLTTPNPRHGRASRPVAHRLDELIAAAPHRGAGVATTRVGPATQRRRAGTEACPYSAKIPGANRYFLKYVFPFELNLLKRLLTYSPSSRNSPTLARIATSPPSSCISFAKP